MNCNGVVYEEKIYFLRKNLSHKLQGYTSNDESLNHTFMLKIKSDSQSIAIKL